MKVQELIDRLKTFDGDLEVWVWDSMNSITMSTDLVLEEVNDDDVGRCIEIYGECRW